MLGKNVFDCFLFQVERIDWTESPWRALPKARDLCQQLLSVDPEERGTSLVTGLLLSLFCAFRQSFRLGQVATLFK